MKFLQRNCRQVAELTLAGEDRALGIFERWAVRAHLKACKVCPTFHRQVMLMREAMPRWRTYRDEVL
jgi:hypothetical protein